jgi:UTP-glucose-1-phosphate uridylyltransferase
MQRGPVHGVVLTARRHDIGDLFEWLSANLRLRGGRRGIVGATFAAGAIAAWLENLQKCY